MSNTIIECRNKESENSVSNGDWTTTLGQSLTINNGDQILVKDIFIDTQATSSQKIIIPNDITAEIELGYYKQQLTTTGISQIAGFPAVSQKDQELILCIQKDSTDPTEVLIEELAFFKFNNRKINEKVDITISYTDFDNQPQSLIVHIPENLNTQQIIPELAGAVAIGDLTYNPPISVLNERFNVNISTFQTLATNGKRICIPYTETAFIGIPKGNYDPDALCTLINNAVTSQGNTGGSFIAGSSPILKDAQGLQTNYRTGNTNTYEFAFAFGGDEIYSIDAMLNYNLLDKSSILMGSNQFELAFNQNTSSFQFNYLHFPFLYQKNIAVEILSLTTGILPVITSQTRYGGVYIKSFGARVDSTSAPFNFWEGLLGFKKSIYPSFEFIEKNITGPPAIDYIIPNTQIDQFNSTAGLVTMDAFVDKTSPIVTNTTFPLYSSLATDQTRNLVAGNSALDVQNSFGYYVIEVGSKFKNNFYTPDNNHKNIQSIVSRYYELNSYTTGTSEGSLIYTHKGEPLLLESFRCRILNSDKVLASNIGNDNTIHIAIIRNSPEYPLPPTTDTDTKKEQKKK